MAFALGNLAIADDRREDRDEVHHRARATGPDGAPVQLLVVNISPHGLMARSPAEFAAGDRLRVTLPGVGALDVDVRWCLGGRLGGQFSRPINLASYYELIALLVRAG